METIAACLTPAGRGAIATLAIRGPRAWEVVRERFVTRSPSPHGRVAPSPSGRGIQGEGSFYLGRLGDGGLADEVVLAVKAMHPVPWVEIHCHGGIEVIRMLLNTFARQGVRVCSWQEFIGGQGSGVGGQGSVVGGQGPGDRGQGSGARGLGSGISGQELEPTIPTPDPRSPIPDPRCELAQALTLRTAGILLDQVDGAFDRAVTAIAQALEQDEVARGRELLEDLLQYGGVGRHLVQPWRVVVAGPPNVGKSSLVNALAGFQRCLVAATPGTTRDVVTTVIALDGWPVELADTAGWRSAADAVEQEGIVRAQTAAAQADFCLWVLDASADLPSPPGRGWGEGMHLVINKIDLPPAWDVDAIPQASRVSALTGEGLPQLCDLIAHRLVKQPPPPGAAVPFTASLVDRLETTLDRLREGNVQEALRLVYV